MVGFFDHAGSNGVAGSEALIVMNPVTIAVKVAAGVPIRSTPCLQPSTPSTINGDIIAGLLGTTFAIHILPASASSRPGNPSPLWPHQPIAATPAPDWLHPEAIKSPGSPCQE